MKNSVGGSSALANVARAVVAAVVLATSALAQTSPQVLPPPKPSDGTVEKAIVDALASAKKTGRHVLLNFGADWCPDCRILDKTFADPVVAAFLKANFVVVPVPVGKYVGQNYTELNLDVVKKYGVFTTRENAGIPSIVILDSDGKVLARTDNGEWRHDPAVRPENVIRDLRRWAPKRQP